ncbi:alpha/beta fold hydrolase [Umezawaea endophytica]|uniref:Alpha/beta fold hydrolase n=1 Tax=Umezawaea endophytica TaxID=1654476 RepID=A0A9X2VWH5_9PSEU|nr:alpha/beta hydrolase [Umezawaea endophytica]MCS7483949.1 alpha/beta fold hydrolase [Umezawaea endophytica]
MPRVTFQDLELEYDSFGDPADPVLLLVMGLGAQMTNWDTRLCELFAAQGFHVVRFDNRDIGLSTEFGHLPLPDFAALSAGDTSSAPYLLSDMAADVVVLLDGLGVERAHLVGASMGGMIAQQVVVDHPERVLSLCSIMSTTGDKTVGQGRPEIVATFAQPAATTREAVIEQRLVASRMTRSPGFAVDEDAARERIAASYDRSNRPMSTLRQLAAVIASPDRTEGLRGVTVPTVVIHGSDDPLVHRSGGEATAAAVPDAELIIIDGMGHDLPLDVWPTVVEAVAANAKRAR